LQLAIRWKHAHAVAEVESDREHLVAHVNIKALKLCIARHLLELHRGVDDHVEGILWCGAHAQSGAVGFVAGGEQE